MRCARAHKSIGPYLDGELAGVESARLEEHLASCRDCALRYAYLKDLKEQLGTLPSITPTAEESRRLANRLRKEMEALRRPTPAPRRLQWAVTASLVLVAAAAIGTAWVLWTGGGPDNEGEVSVTEERPVSTEPAGIPGEGQAEEELYAGAVVPAASVSPVLDLSEMDYTPDDLDSYSNDLGTRIDFYSAYWQPSLARGTKPVAPEELQRELLADLSSQAEVAGEDPAALEAAIDSAMRQAGEDTCLPCHVELARLDGAEVWLVSLSSPEDNLLLKDPDLAPAINLASLGGETGMRVSEAALKELARQLAPYYGGFQAAAASGGEGAETANGQLGEDTTLVAPDGGAGEAMQPEGPSDFKSLLKVIAAQMNSTEMFSLLEGLNYDQLLLLLQGNWSTLAEENIFISDLLTLPDGLYAVDTASGEVLWPRP